MNALLRKLLICPLLICSVDCSYAFFSSENPISITVANSKTFLEQGYLDNYNIHKGNSGVGSIGLSSLYQLHRQQDQIALVQLNSVNYPDINTRTYSATAIYRNISCNQYKSGSYMGLDITFYNKLEFQQVYFGHEIKHPSYLINLELDLPYFGGKQYTGDADETQVTSARGINAKFTHNIDQLSTSVGVSYYTNKNIDDDIFVTDLGVQYQFKMLFLAANYQFFDGFKNDSSGFKLSAVLPITSVLYSPMRSKTNALTPILRNPGVLIQKLKT